MGIWKPNGPIVMRNRKNLQYDGAASGRGQERNRDFSFGFLDRVGELAPSLCSYFSANHREKSSKNKRPSGMGVKPVEHGRIRSV
jgi:hypothetical protein